MSARARGTGAACGRFTQRLCHAVVKRRRKVRFGWRAADARGIIAVGRVTYCDPHFYTLTSISKGVGQWLCACL